MGYIIAPLTEGHVFYLMLSFIAIIGLFGLRKVFNKYFIIEEIEGDDINE